MLTHQEESPIAKMFRALDSDGNGKLSKQELVETSTSLKLFTPEEAEEIFEKCDMDRSGFIDYNEFLVATMSWNQLLSDQKAQMVFKYFEKCGKLSLDELKSCFTNVSEKEWREFLLQVDEDKNGDISLQEFKEYLINTIRS
jgi:calcium-dependent protein kinase